MKLEVTTFDTGCTDKEQAVKVLEEAAEVFGAWQEYEDIWHVRHCIDRETRCIIEDILADEIADVLWVLAAIANQHGIDLTEAFRNNLGKKNVRDCTRHLDNPKLTNNHN